MTDTTGSAPAQRRTAGRGRAATLAAAVTVALAAAACGSDDDTAASPDPTATTAAKVNQPTTTTAVPSTDPPVTSTGSTIETSLGQLRPPLPTEPPSGSPVNRHLDALPADFEPVVWPDPPPRPAMDGPLAPNQLLTDAAVYGEDLLDGAEDIAPGLDGHLYTGTHDGTLWRLSAEGTTVAGIEPVASLGGPVLGLDSYDDHTMIAAVVGIGLVAVDTVTGEHTVLSNELDGTLITFPDGVAVAADGTIYFTEASTRYVPGFPADFLDGRASGRVLRYEPGTQETTVVVDGLYFANGIVVAPDESYVLVAESFRFRLARVWLDPDRFGTTEPFGPGLINGADNIRADQLGRIWVGGSNLRSDLVDAALTNADVRRQLATLSADEAGSVTAPYGFAQVLDADGNPIASFHDATGRFHSVSAALPHGDVIVFGSLGDQGIAVVPTPPELAS